MDYGSGFVLTPAGDIISAAHLFPTDLRNLTISGRIAYFKNDDDRERDNLIDISLVSKEVGDVALLKFSRNPEGMRPLPIAPKAPAHGNTLYVLGFPGGQNLNTSYPAVYQGVLSPKRFQYQGVANKGNSGGPILDRNGYVVGIVTESEDVINTIPISNTYLGLPASELPTPKGFDPASVMPLYLPREGFASTTLSKDTPSWSTDDIKRVLDEYRSGQRSRYCRINVPTLWNFRRKPELGFLFAPPVTNPLLKEQFQFEFIVRRKEDYLIRQQERELAPHFGAAPYNVAPLFNQSIVLLKSDTGRQGSHDGDVVAFIFAKNGDNYILFRYLPRYFNEYQFRPNEANSALLMCMIKATAPRELFFNLCEDLGQQAIDRYYDLDNPCLPGGATP